MTREAAKKYLVDWLEGRLSNKKSQQLQQLLETDQELHRYFEKMAEVMHKPALSALPRLEPDPFLPTQIKALAEQSSRAANGENFSPLWGGKLRWAVSTGMFVIAISTGIFLGKGLAESSAQYDDTEIVSAYYEAFSQSGLGENWNYLEPAEEADQQ